MRTFYTLVITQLLSLIGSRMTGVAIGFWVYAETGSAAPLLIAAFFAELPEMVGGIFTGMLADRFHRRWIIMIGDAGQAVGTVILLLTIHTGVFQLWHLYAVVLMQGIFSIIQSPATRASVTMLVPEAQLDRANGMMEISFNLAGIVAPALAGLVYSIGGLQAVIAIDLLTFLAAILIVFFQHIPMPEQSEAGKAASGSLRAEMLGGLHYLWQRPLLWWTVVYIAFIFFLINGPLGMVIPYLSQITADESVLGLLMSTMSAGALAGSLLVMRGGENPRRMRLILLLYVLHGIMLMLYGITRDPLWMGVVLFVLMLPLPFAGALFSTILQTRTPPDLQGRVFAITGQMFTLTTPFSFLITAYLVDEVLEPAVQQPVWSTFAPLLGNQPGAGMGLILVTIGVVITLLSLLMLAIPAVRHLEAHLNG